MLSCYIHLRVTAVAHTVYIEDFAVGWYAIQTGQDTNKKAAWRAAFGILLLENFTLFFLACSCTFDEIETR